MWWDEKVACEVAKWEGVPCSRNAQVVDGGWWVVGGGWWVVGGGWSVVDGRWWMVGGDRAPCTPSRPSVSRACDPRVLLRRNEHRRLDLRVGLDALDDVVELLNHLALHVRAQAARAVINGAVAHAL